MDLLVKFQESNVMKKYIIFILILFNFFLQAQIKLNDKSIDSIIIKNSCKCFDFHFNKGNTEIVFSEITKDEGIIPTKLSVLADDKNGFNIIMKGEKEYVYSVIYKYDFIINGSVFYNAFFRYNNSQNDIEIIKTIINNINAACLKIKKRKFISPQKAENIVRQKGFGNTFYQIIESQYSKPKIHYFKTITKDVWIFKEQKGDRMRTIVLNARNGKVLSDYIQ